MIVYCSMIMKYTPLILLSVLSVLLIPIMQTVNAQNPLDQLLGGLKNLTGGASKAVNNTASQAGQSANNTASQAGQSANKATNSSSIQSNAASYPGNASDAGNNNISKSNPVGGMLQNATKGVSDTLGKLFNPGNNTTK